MTWAAGLLKRNRDAVAGVKAERKIECRRQRLNVAAELSTGMCRKPAGHLFRWYDALRVQRRRDGNKTRRDQSHGSSAAPGLTGLHVEILHVERVLFDEFAAALHVLAHQRGEDLFA